MAILSFVIWFPDTNILEMAAELQEKMQMVPTVKEELPKDRVQNTYQPSKFKDRKRSINS
jgi:hypothetical protein